MPPKRRKISVGSEADSENETARDKSSVMSEECVATEDNTLGSIVSSPESTLKNEIPQPTRISKRLIIKRNKFIDEEDPKDKVQAKPARSTTPRKPRTTTSGRQTKQNIDSNKGKSQKVWSLADKRTFFLGLQQYGKNFEAISKKISQAARVRGFPTKDKVQVQYFYYRNWRKIAKFVDMKAADVPMKTQELYSLINYGVLHKYVKENDPSFGECLNNLIHNGETTFMRKNNKGNRKNRCGKLRTPICTCLKKINRLIDVNSSQSASAQKLPQTISIELTPRNSKAWAKVQSVSQNPRLRIKVPSSRTLESVIKFLSKKWKPQRTKNKEKLGVVEESRENLVMFLHPNTRIFPVTLLAHHNEKVDVTFSSYKQNVLPLIQSEKKPQASKGADKAGGSEKEKEKSSQDSHQEQGTTQHTGGVQSSLFSLCDSSHSQKSEEKLTLFIPEHRHQDGNEPLQAVESSPTGAATHSGKNMMCMSPLPPAKEETVVNSPKTLCPASVLLEDENAMFPDSSGPFSPSSISSSILSSLQPLRSQPEVCLSPLIMQQQMSPGPSKVTSPSVGRKKRIGSRNTKKAATSDGPLPTVSEPNSSAPSAPNNENNTTASTSPAKQQECPGPATSGPQERSPHKDSEQEISRLKRLATEDGFTALNSHTVTLLHLSVLLGRETLVRLQYEWREKRPGRSVPGPGMGGVAAGGGGGTQISQLLGQAANQMSNLLRRLCNLATLELTDFVRESELKASKTSTSAVCSRCSVPAGGTTSASNSTTVTSAKGSITRTRRQCLLNQTERQTERAQEEVDITSTSIVPTTKDMGIQTDAPAAQIPMPFPGLSPSTVRLTQAPGATATVRLPGNVQVLQQASVVTSGGRTFVAGTPAPVGAQVNGGDQMFRVPLIPAFRDAARVEQMKQEQQRRLQETAKTILEQGSNQRKLLKRRRVLNKKRKEPPVIVQRTLMPKIDAGEMVTYIQQPTLTTGSNAVLYNLNPSERVVAHTVTPQSVSISAKTSTGLSVELHNQADQQQKGNDILQQAALDAQIDLTEDQASSTEIRGVVVSSKDESDETKSFGPKPLSEETTITRSGDDVVNISSGSNIISEQPAPDNPSSSPSPQISMNADISMSDFDISLSGVSNMGPDAGDKFLDLVLQNSDQGFSGLLSTPKKSTSAGPTLPLFTSSSSPVLTTTYDSRMLRTPTHFGSSAPMGLITPVKLDLDQAWASSLAVGDISLSNILDDSSTFRTTYEQKSPSAGPSSLLPSQIDMSSSDSFMKHTDVADLSFRGLLGDPSFRKDDDSTCGLSPPLSSASLPTSLPSLVSATSNSSGALLSTMPGATDKGEEEGRGSSLLFSEVSQDSFSTKLDVDGSLHGMIGSESSLDLVSKFGALAGVVTSGVGGHHGEDTATLGVTLGPLTVKCREEAADPQTVKLESPSA
ncbi:protein cramped-like protein [Elysia marginata]|uniref:Protein cramped-like protein n=1 Tax=Elysia marginata TaxID=1093978 RepID=A0AAV4JWV2_9GAST|nr:protein cramped-like protein [Elysia marginata]